MPFSRRGPTPNRVCQGCSSLQGVTFVKFRILHHRFMGYQDPQYGGFQPFRVSEHRFMGSPTP